MITPQEIAAGEVRTTMEEKARREREVKEYNDRAYALRALKERRMALQTSYMGVNVVLAAAIAYVGMRFLRFGFLIGTFGYVALAVNFIAALYLVFKLNNLKLAALVSLITLFAHWSYIIVVAANFGIMFMHDDLVKKLEREPGYPEFQNLRLIVTDEEVRPMPHHQPMQRPVPKQVQPQNTTAEKPDNGGMMEI